MDYFYLDLEKKEIRVYSENIEDSFVDGLQGINKIEVIKSKEKNVSRESKSIFARNRRTSNNRN